MRPFVLFPDDEVVRIQNSPFVVIRSIFKGCLFVLFLAFLAGSGGWYFVWKNPSSSDTEQRFTWVEGLRERIAEIFREGREWTDVSGRKLDGVFISGTDETALIRVLSTQRIYRIPLSRLSEADQDFVRSRAREVDAFNEIYPPVASHWPQRVEGRTQPLNLKKKTDGSGWISTHYDFQTDSELEPELIEALATTCEAVDVVIRNSPLPLSWGRDPDKKRPIVIHASMSKFIASGAQEHWGAFYSVRSNEVHVPLVSLTGANKSAFSPRFQLRKRDTYQILVHELIHQASVGFLVLGVPAWVGEGTSELYSALQTSPGQFSFVNHRALIRRYLDEQINARNGVENVLRLRSLPLPQMDDFLSLNLSQYNRRTSESPNGGFCEYAAAMLLTEYFCFADNNSMRTYLEAVFTGLSPAEAAELHLMRGRSSQQIESLLAGRWADLGLTLRFVDNPNLESAFFQGELGL